jgi:hypothetical protein
MSLREFVGDAIYRWLVGESRADKTVCRALSGRIAKQNRVTAFDAPMRCPACSYEWLYSVNLERAKLSEAIENLVCPRCGAEPARIRTDWLRDDGRDRTSLGDLVRADGNR